MSTWSSGINDLGMTSAEADRAQGPIVVRAVREENRVHISRVPGCVLALTLAEWNQVMVEVLTQLDPAVGEG